MITNIHSVTDYELMTLTAWFMWYEPGVRHPIPNMPEIKAVKLAIDSGLHFKFFTTPPGKMPPPCPAERLRTYIKPEYLELFDIVVEELTMAAM